MEGGNMAILRMLRRVDAGFWRWLITNWPTLLGLFLTVLGGTTLSVLIYDNAGGFDGASVKEIVDGVVPPVVDRVVPPVVDGVVPPVVDGVVPPVVDGVVLPIQDKINAAETHAKAAHDNVLQTTSNSHNFLSTEHSELYDFGERILVACDP
jgi:hypothetical protein